MLYIYIVYIYIYLETEPPAHVPKVVARSAAGARPESGPHRPATHVVVAHNKIFVFLIDIFCVFTESVTRARRSTSLAERDRARDTSAPRYEGTKPP